MPSSRLTIVLLLASMALSCSGQVKEQQQSDPMVASESSPQHQIARPAVLLKQVPTELVSNAYQLAASSKSYLDTQPEFTQAWADFPYAPGYLPAAFKSSHTPYQQQLTQYRAQGGAVNPNGIGFGYIDWSGPVNPAALYVPVPLPYYYRIPPLTPVFQPQPAIYQPLIKQVVYQAPKPAVHASKTPVYTSPTPKY